MYNLEEAISKINSNIFLKEFTFSKNKFKSSSRQELEFADNVVRVEDFMIIYQLKERDTESNTTIDELKWFDNKVIHKGVKQIKDTLKYINANHDIDLTNHRGHKLNFNNVQFTYIIKLIIYSPSKLLPLQKLNKKFYLSSTGGLIHILSIEEYLQICETMVTIAEIGGYFDFREKMLMKDFDKNIYITEKSLIGQYLSNNLNSLPKIIFEKYYDDFINDLDEFDISHILNNYAEKIEYYEMDSYTDYYNVLVECAMLKRNELIEFKKRFNLCLEIVRENKFELPYRFVCPRTNCGFVFIPLQKNAMSIRVNALKNLTIGSKYDQKLEVQIGISFVWDKPHFLIDWCYLNYPWAYEEKTEEMLKEKNPFRPLKTEILKEYQFKNEKQ